MRTAAGRGPAGAVRVAALAVALALCAALPAEAGGPLDLYNHQPIVYPNGGTALVLNVDQGPFGTRTNAQAATLIQNAIALWNGVATSTVRLAVGPALSTDYTSANYGAIFNHFADGINPVIFDSNGSITDLIFGAGAKSSVLGFAGSAYWTSGAQAGTYVEGQAVLNGALNVSDATWTVVLAHEFGHFFGLDHSQLDGTQGLSTSNYVLMYPVAYRTLFSLHEDDVAAVTALYPTAGAPAVYGQLAGTFTTAGGTPILGANIWAKETATGKVYSAVSDFLMQGSGYFRLYLPVGSYTLHAESIDASFTGGSSVGPYSVTATDVSFQPPHPITPVALGGAQAQQIPIRPGCLATATFRLDGTGAVSGNCAAPPAATTTLTSSVNPSNAGASVKFTAQVAGATPTGNVAFSDSGTVIPGCGSVVLTGGGNTPTAQCNTSSLAVGAHQIAATYGGDANNAGSAGALTQVVKLASTTYTITVTNNGPSEVTGAVITEPAPAGLTIGAWTCSVTNAGSGGVVTTGCGAASGTGPLNTTANLKAGGVVTYTVAALVTATGGSVTNTARVNAPAGMINIGTHCTANGGSNPRAFDPVTGTCSAGDTDPVVP